MSTTSAETSPTDLVLTPLLREEVEKRVAAGLIAAVRDKMFYIHRKRGFTTSCDCSYCELKRQATFDIGTLRYKSALTRTHNHNRSTEMTHWGLRQVLSNRYRKQLKLLEGK